MCDSWGDRSETSRDDDAITSKHKKPSTPDLCLPAHFLLFLVYTSLNTERSIHHRVFFQRPRDSSTSTTSEPTSTHLSHSVCSPILPYQSSCTGSSKQPVFLCIGEQRGVDYQNQDPLCTWRFGSRRSTRNEEGGLSVLKPWRPCNNL